MPKIDERISDLETRLKQLKAKQTQMNARRRATESRKDRREDTRRKILVGSIVLAKIDAGEFDDSHILTWLDQELTRNEDRALFELAERPAVNGGG